MRSRRFQDRRKIPPKELGMVNSRHMGKPSQWPQGRRTYLPRGTLHGEERGICELYQFQKTWQ
jgi:hypothetical protein